MKKNLFALVAVCAVGAAIWYFTLGNAQPAPPFVKVGAVTVPVRLADTPELKSRGLSGLESLPADSGMLFRYDTPGPRAFWMKDMRFPIDIIWIGADLRVTDITRNAVPESYPETFSPSGPVLHVLEVNAGFADRYGIRPGDRVVIHLD